MDTLHRPEIFERIIEVDQQARKALVNAVWIPRVATVAYKGKPVRLAGDGEIRHGMAADRTDRLECHPPLQEEVGL